MQPFSQKYAIVQFFEEVAVHEVFTSDSWPLHSTVVDTFAINWSRNELERQLSDLLSNMPRAYSMAESAAYFGRRGQIEVVLLKKTSDLRQLHNKTIVRLERGGLKLNDPQFAREGFLPHATVRHHSRLNQGDKVGFDALSVVDMFPDGDPYSRKVIATIQLDTNSLMS